METAVSSRLPRGSCCLHPPCWCHEPRSWSVRLLAQGFNGADEAYAASCKQRFSAVASGPYCGTFTDTTPVLTMDFPLPVAASCSSPKVELVLAVKRVADCAFVCCLVTEGQ